MRWKEIFLKVFSHTIDTLLHFYAIKLPRQIRGFLFDSQDNLKNT